MKKLPRFSLSRWNVLRPLTAGARPGEQDQRRLRARFQYPESYLSIGKSKVREKVHQCDIGSDEIV